MIRWYWWKQLLLFDTLIWQVLSELAMEEKNVKCLGYVGKLCRFVRELRVLGEESLELMKFGDLGCKM